MATLLIVHHTPSPATHAVLEAVREGTRADGLESVDVTVRAALAATASDVMAADGYVLGTPANLGYMSGALKHFLDTIYYPCLDETVGRPFGNWIHGDDDTHGAQVALDRIVSGLGWTRVAPALHSVAKPDRATMDAAWELGATVAANLIDA